MTTKTPLIIDVVKAEDHAVLTPQGYLNAPAGDQIEKICADLLEQGTRYFIVNFGQVETINTIGISILVGLIERVVSSQGLVYFTEIGGTTKDIFEALNLTTVALIFPSNEAACEHLRRDRATMKRAMGE